MNAFVIEGRSTVFEHKREGVIALSKLDPGLVTVVIKYYEFGI